MKFFDIIFRDKSREAVHGVGFPAVAISVLLSIPPQSHVRLVETNHVNEEAIREVILHRGSPLRWTSKTMYSRTVAVRVRFRRGCSRGYGKQPRVLVNL